MPAATRNILLGLIAAPAVICPAWSADKTFDQHFNAPAGSQLTLDTDVGSVTVTGHESRDVSIHADISGSYADAVKIQAQQQASSIEVTGRAPGMHFFGPGVRFTIEVPRDCAVDLKTAGGSIDVRRLNARARGSTSGGPVEAHDIAGPVTLHTSGGGITVTHVTGDLEVDTSGGGIDLGDVDGRIRAQTSGGDVRVDARSNHGISIVTSGGPIDLRLPADTRADIDARTSGGGIRLQLPMTKTELSESDRLKGEVNGGGDQIVLRTSGGGIEIAAR